LELTRAQLTVLEKARALGGGAQGVALTDEACKGLIAVTATDVGIRASFPEVPEHFPQYFETRVPEELELEAGDLYEMFYRLVSAVEDGETYFSSLASLHKGRVKFRKILATQPIPTIDQVGPRGLLEYGALPTPELVALLFWRKWMYDIDNRAAQETGYLFEPIIAGAIGGAPAPARSSPVKRRGDPSKGRQVDCIRMGSAYEFKLRVTIAASGQGRWQEELDFPEDCRVSGFKPELIVFDPTPNPKLEELKSTFEQAGGTSHVGPAAWAHLEDLAGPTMGKFVDKYVRDPLENLLRNAPDALPELRLRMESERMIFALGLGEYEVERGSADLELASSDDVMPDDAPNQLPGV
jgi:hypothetical protein